VHRTRREEHVVGTDERIDDAHEGRVAQCDGEHPRYGAGTWLSAETDDEKERSGNDADVPDDVLEELQVREANRQVGGEHGLERAGKPPEPGQLDEQSLLRPPAGHGGNDKGDVTERQR
jgi:hypothetical protein